MTFRVLLTDDAARDLEGLYGYIIAHDSPISANYVLDQIEQVLITLSEFPHRGNYPKELLPLGIHEYRETYFKPYRIIYRAIDNTVYVYLIADSRRDLQTLLARRLLGV